MQELTIPTSFIVCTKKTLKFLFSLCSTRYGHSIKKPTTIFLLSQPHKHTNISRHHIKEYYQYCEVLCIRGRKEERKEHAILGISTGVCHWHISATGLHLLRGPGMHHPHASAILSATLLLCKLSPAPIRLELRTPGHAPRWFSSQPTYWACPGLASPLAGQLQPHPILMGAHATPRCWQANVSRTGNHTHHACCWLSPTEHILKGRKISLT